MKVVICGAGRVGYNIAAYLSRESNDITIIDINADLIHKISRTLDVKAFVGQGASPELLARAGLETADMIVAVTHSDEVNMVACQVAHSLFNVPKKIARVRNQDFRQPAWINLFSRDHMPIDMIISPEVEVAKALHERLVVVGASEVIPLHNNLVYMIGVICDANCPVLHTPLRQLKQLFPEISATVVSIIREQKAFIPDGDSQILEGDEAFFVVGAAHVQRVMTALGHEQRESRRVVLLGGGNVGYELMLLLHAVNPDVDLKVIEQSEARAMFLAEQDKEALIIHGDGLDPDILREAGVDSCEAFVAITDDDETNALASLQAKNIGAQRALTLLNRESYSDLLLSIDIDAIISPQDVTVSRIMRHVRRGRIKAVFNLRNSFAEIIEAEASESCKIINTPIQELDLPEAVHIGAIIRDETYIPPMPDTVIKPGDYVIILALEGHGVTVEKLFSVDVDLF